MAEIGFGTEAATADIIFCVRFTPQSGHERSITKRPLWAKSGHNGSRIKIALSRLRAFIAIDNGQIYFALPIPPMTADPIGRLNARPPSLTGLSRKSPTIAHHVHFVRRETKILSLLFAIIHLVLHICQFGLFALAWQQQKAWAIYPWPLRS